MKQLTSCGLFFLLVLAFANTSHSGFGGATAGNPFGLQGYVSQALQFSLEGEEWDTERDLNSALTNFFLEADYKINPNWSAYGSSMISFDWIYQIKKSDSSWEERQFDRSKDELQMDSEWWQLLKELHVTWDPGAFFLRLGKQRVSWGEMEVFAVNDLINPTDQTRGFSELELETVVIPIPLLRAEYAFDVDAGVVSDLGIQFVWNMNPDFIGNQGTFYGNDEAGIWAVDVTDETSFGFPVRYGRQDVFLDEPDSFDPDGFEYGVKLSSLIGYNTLFSLMGFTGKSNTPATTFGAAFAADAFTVVDDDGRAIVNVTDTGDYPDQKFVGFSLATQLPLKINALGGFEPVVRFEGSYQMDNQFYNFDPNTFAYTKLEETDTIVLGANFDYKIKVPWQRQFINIFYEVQYNKHSDYETEWDISPSSIYRQEYYNHYAWVGTGYSRGEWEPYISWYALDNAMVQILTPGLNYHHSSSWDFGIKANLFGGEDIKDWGFENKSNAVLTAQYQF